jgi:heme exporter protein B
MVLRKEMVLLWHGRGRLASVLSFAATVLLLFSFAAGPDSKLLSRQAPGYIWLALLLASTLSLGESLRVEIDDQALLGLRLLPVDPRALFLGKALGNAALLVALLIALVPLAFLLYGIDPAGPLWALPASLLLGVLGLAAPGTLYAAMASQSRGRDVLLPMLLLPLVVPVLLGGVKASSLALHGDPMGQAPSWLALLLCFDVIYWAIGVVLFERVVES